jgi:hypothetical protein
MKRFEYIMPVVRFNDLSKFLDEKGKEGWELTSAVELSRVVKPDYRLFLKRELIVLDSRLI